MFLFLFLGGRGLLYLAVGEFLLSRGGGVKVFFLERMFLFFGGGLFGGGLFGGGGGGAGLFDFPLWSIRTWAKEGSDQIKRSLDFSDISTHWLTPWLKDKPKWFRSNFEMQRFEKTRNPMVTPRLLDMPLLSLTNTNTNTNTNSNTNTNKMLSPQLLGTPLLSPIGLQHFPRPGQEDCTTTRSIFKYDHLIFFPNLERSFYWNLPKP